MKESLIFILLDIVGLIILIKWIRLQISVYKTSADKKSFFTYVRFKYIILAFAFISIPLLTINYTNIETLSIFPEIYEGETSEMLFAVLLSFLVSFMWLYYIYKLDLFNKEKKYHIFIVLILSAGLTSLARFPYQLMDEVGFTMVKDPFDSFIYCVFGIGLVEETIKLIPLLVILFFTKAIDEPYDYILYASTAALGFSFVENANYLYYYGLEIINARALYATVAHMAFSSMIAYGLFLIKYKYTKFNSILVFSFFFFLAIFSHGFYDFWLLNAIARPYNWLTTLFLLISVHIWFSIKNNTINASNFYTEEVKLNNDKLKVFLIKGLLSIFMFSYLYMAFSTDSKQANIFFKQTLVTYGFIIFYIIATLTKYNLVKGMVKPFKFTLKFLFPKIDLKK